MYTGGIIDEYFLFQVLDQEQNFVRVYLDDGEATRPDGILIAPGSMVSRCLQAMKQLFLRYEISLQLFVPAQIYPFEVQTLLPYLHGVDHLFVVEESVAGGTWGCEVAQHLYSSLWGSLKYPIHLIHSKESIIPSAPHLEKRVIVQAEDIATAVVEATHASD
jgi:pyruvate dehydrogenase E1 component beta subunit